MRKTSLKGDPVDRDITPEIEIQNVVATVVLGHRLDLKAIVKSFAHVDYRPERFPGLVFRFKKPKTATLIFSSGKMVCTGAKNQEDAS